MVRTTASGAVGISGLNVLYTGRMMFKQTSRQQQMLRIKTQSSLELGPISCVRASYFRIDGRLTDNIDHDQSAVSPWQFKDLSGGQNWVEYSDTLWKYRWEQAISLKPDIVEIVTWNDYGEVSLFDPCRDTC